MKIVSLVAENVKRLTASRDHTHWQHGGDHRENGQGKTSVLDSIWWALSGLSNVQGKPIREGATEARIKLDLGEIVVTRKFTDKGSTLKVESADGTPFKTPQAMLDDLMGALLFDPLALARMDAKKPARMRSLSSYLKSTSRRSNETTKKNTTNERF